jgi:subfamily B ATP-binding cassette protein MsbA
MLDFQPSIKDAVDAKPLRVDGGALRFDDVVYAYDGTAPALEGVSLEVPAGQTVALVGPSGAGKTTILNLIPRFYDVASGRVLVDGQDVRSVTQASLRSNIALVSQESTLFNDTVRANIAYGRIGASEAEIIAAATSAAAHDFISALPEGYDTVVGESGVKLSGGQRQRIAIARAMLKDAPILLLDEATSALDTHSERQVQEALHALSRDRTTLVVAHRLSTVQDADRIHVIDAGRIVETGRHAELMARGGLYAKLYTLQAAPEAGSAAVAQARTAGPV